MLLNISFAKSIVVIFGRQVCELNFNSQHKEIVNNYIFKKTLAHSHAHVRFFGIKTIKKNKKVLARNRYLSYL